MPQEEEKTVGRQVDDAPSSPEPAEKDFPNYVRVPPMYTGYGNPFVSFDPGAPLVPSYFDPQRSRYSVGYIIGPAGEIIPSGERVGQQAEITTEDAQKLTLRINQLMADAAATWQRIAKDREVVQTLKEDTRATLRRMRG